MSVAGVDMFMNAGSEVIMGAYNFDGSFVGEGAVFGYMGTVNAFGPDRAFTLLGGQVGAQFGISVAAAGDVNADGLEDFLVGAHLHDNGQTDEGLAGLYLGGRIPQFPHFSVESGQVNGGMGLSVAGAGDVDGDGFPDVVMGAYLFDGGQTDEGRVTVIH